MKKNEKTLVPKLWNLKHIWIKFDSFDKIIINLRGWIKSNIWTFLLWHQFACERERVGVRVRVREREWVCVCVRVREREWVCMWVSECACGRNNQV